ncbi:hypothetical protein ACTXGK_10595 [Psychrobacter sp. T6-5]|uniref:hypothetical protein n=1 Tax=Psychrobacter sp. T6-5 TaxID=3457451 RepID=UPI003FD11892
MGKLSILLLSGLFMTGANAGCFGSSNLYSCNDPQSGNNYQVNKFGSSTYMTGNNPRTGSTWSQNSSTYGNITYQNGTSSDGSTWRQTIQDNGSMGRTYSGTDSQGNYYSKTCSQFGCY